MVDAHYENPRLAALYDPLDSDRSDLEVYAAMAAEFGAREILDIGCGTGTFGCLLASRGLAVTGLDPALASLDIARRKEFGDRVRWVHGTVDALTAAGFAVAEIRDAPDRPGLEFVFIAAPN